MAGRLSTRRPVLSAALTAAILWATPSAAWWGNGHAILARAAVLAQPQEVPAFFRAASAAVGEMSKDPDVAKNRAAPHLYDGESPEHFLDLELLDGADLPELRGEFVALCARLGQAPAKIGYAPYAIAEYTERLTIAFAEYRRWPQDAMVQAKILVYAGFLAHYAADLAQPLHATVHYNGRVGADGSRTDAGIHEKVDSLIERLELDPADLARTVTVAPFEGDLFAAVRAQLFESNGRVDRVYELADGLDPVSAPARDFAQERARRAVSFTASLFLTAWQQSEGVRLPGWLAR